MLLNDVHEDAVDVVPQLQVHVALFLKGFANLEWRAASYSKDAVVEIPSQCSNCTEAFVTLSAPMQTSRVKAALGRTERKPQK